MKVKIDGSEGQVHVTQEETKTSVSTGRPLRRFEADVSFVTPRDDVAIQALQQDNPTFTAVFEDGSEVLCAARVLTSSYTEGDPHRHYSIELQEIEELSLERLDLAQEEVHPDHYKEEIRHNILTCDVTAALAKETLERFWNLRGADGEEQYFDVVRQGISENPRRMRFGRILWQQSDQHAPTIQTSFVLVDKAYDDDPENRRPWLHGPHEATVREHTARHDLVLDALLDALVERSIIASDDVQTIRQIANDKQWQRQLDFYKVDDLEEWTR